MAPDGAWRRQPVGALSELCSRCLRRRGPLRGLALNIWRRRGLYLSPAKASRGQTGVEITSRAHARPDDTPASKLSLLNAHPRRLERAGGIRILQEGQLQAQTPRTSRSSPRHGKDATPRSARRVFLVLRMPLSPQLIDHRAFLSTFRLAVLRSWVGRPSHSRAAQLRTNPRV